MRLFELVLAQAAEVVGSATSSEPFFPEVEQTVETRAWLILPGCEVFPLVKQKYSQPRGQVLAELMCVPFVPENC